MKEEKNITETGNEKNPDFGPKIDRNTGRIEFTDSYSEFMDSYNRKGQERRDDYQSEEEYRESADERRIIRLQRQRRRRRIIALLTVIVAVFVIVMFAISHMNSAYDSEDDFDGFADQKFRKMKTIPNVKDRVITYEYGEPVSFAYRFDPSANEQLAVFRDQKVEQLKKDFTKSVKKEIKNGGDSGGRFFHKDTNYAMLFDSAVYDSGNGALTMAIYSVEYREEDGKMAAKQTSVQTYLLDKRNLQELSPMQVMTADYKEKCEAFAVDYINKHYDDDEILPDAAQYMKDNDSNFNQFVMDNGETTVFFDEGTVVDAAEGVVGMTIPKVYMGTSVRSKVINRYVDPDKPMVAITYDDGPGGKSETRILKCLKKYGAVATFFYLGSRVDYASDNIKTAYEMGCEVGNHSWDHPDLTGLSGKQIKAQLDKTNKKIAGITGVKPEIFRPPYGSFNDSVLKASGMPAILWDVDTLDWSSRNAKSVYKVIKKTKKLDGKIILMHSIYDSTAEATEKIVPYLQKQGYQLVTVSELIKYKTGEAPKAGKSY